MSRRPAPTRRPRPSARLGCAAVAVLLLAAGCERKAPSADLFPLEAGHRWTYRQQVEMEDNRSERGTLVLRTLPSEDLEGKSAFRRHSDDGVDYWLRRDETGVFRVATRHELQAEIAKDPAPRYVLKEPLAVGTEWQVASIPYLLERRQGFPPELRHESKPVTMRFEIEALKQSVEVPAGRFDGCVKVRGQGAVKLYADAVVGWKDLPITTVEWYCPGPGLVKLERSEPAKSPFLIGGTLVLELAEWRSP